MVDVEIRLYETSTPDGHLPDSVIRELCVQARRGNNAARERILCTHMGLIVHVAKYFYRPGAFLDLNDLVQQGCLGLLHAIDKFNPCKVSRGKRVRFMTYAHYWVVHYIRREIEKHGRTIAVPVKRLREVHPVVVSCDGGPEWGEDGVSGVFQVADAEDTPENWCRGWEARQLMEQLLMKLSEPMRWVVRHRYGLAGTEGQMNSKQLSKKLGITEAFVQTLERASLHALREHALANPLLQ